MSKGSRRAAARNRSRDHRPTIVRAAGGAAAVAVAEAHDLAAIESASAESAETASKAAAPTTADSLDPVVETTAEMPPPAGNPLPPPGEHSLSTDMAAETADMEDGFYKKGIAAEKAEVGSKEAEIWHLPLQDLAARSGRRAAFMVAVVGTLTLLGLILWKSLSH